MKVAAVFVALMAGASAHTLFSKLYVDGQDQVSLTRPSESFHSADICSREMALASASPGSQAMQHLRSAALPAPTWLVATTA